MPRWLGPDLWTRLHLPGSARQLAILRIFFAGLVLFLYSSPMLLFMHELQLPRFRGLTWSLIPTSIELQLYHDAIPYLYWVGFAATAAMALGLLTRVSTITATLCFVLQFDVYYRLTKSHVDWPYWNFIFLIFCLTPAAADRLSLDALLRRVRGAPAPARAAQEYRWPVEVIGLWICLTYTFAGIAKIFPLRAGVEWLQGGMLHYIATTMVFDSPVYWLLGQTPFDYSLRWPWAFMSTSAVILELCAFTMLLQRRLNLPIMIGLLLFHFGVYLTAGVIAFVYDALICCAFLIPPEVFGDVPAAAAPGEGD
ncbi:MAG: HTTM domain-containing protein [Myxococcales bacterium]|nr:HTTM domain-containing protein [Myxococcales bacterium]